MKQLAIGTLAALLLSFQAKANGGFEPTPRACVNVGKEISRVTIEMNGARSGIQKSWLKRQLNALNTKRSSCSRKGFRVD